MIAHPDQKQHQVHIPWSIFVGEDIATSIKSRKRSSISSTSSTLSSSSLSSSPSSSTRKQQQPSKNNKMKNILTSTCASIAPLQENIMSNPRYLLDRCLHFDWDNVQLICNFLLRIFHSASSPSTIHFVIDDDLLNAALTQLVTRDSFGNTILHATCYHKPPVSIIQTILECCIEAESLVAAVSQTADVATDNSSSKQFQLHLKKNHRQATPLLVACLAAASRDVLQELLNHDDDDATTATTATSIIIEPDNAGRTTFHGLLTRYELLCKLPPFRNYGSNRMRNDSRINSSTSASTSINTNASNSCFSSNNKTRRGSKQSSCNNEYQRYHEFYSVDDSTSIDDSDDDETTSTVSSFSSSTSSPTSHKRKSLSTHDHLSCFTSNTNSTNLLHAFWETTDLLLQTAWEKHNNNGNSLDSTSILERAANVAHCCPTKLIDMIFEQQQCDFYGEQKDEDEEGYHHLSPLHLAVTSATATESSTIHPQLSYQHQYMIECLLEKNPSAAYQVLPTTNRTPFCEAILHGLQWHNTQSVEQLRRKSLRRRQAMKNKGQQTEANNDSAIDGPLKSLWNYAPEMIHTVDPITGLYPFALAASVEYNKNKDAETAGKDNEDENETNIDDFDDSDNDENDEDENKKNDNHYVQVLDTVYNLLRLYPQVINNGTTTN